MQKNKDSCSSMLILLLFVYVNLWNYIDRGIIPGDPIKVEDFLRRTLSISSSQESEYFGLLASCFLFSYATFSLIFGAINGVVDSLALLGIALSIWCVSSALCAIAEPSHSFYCLLIGRILSGVGEAAVQTIVPCWIDEEFSKWKTSAIALFSLSIPVGLAVGYSLGAVTGFHVAFIVETVFMLPIPVICFLIAFKRYQLIHSSSANMKNGNKKSETGNTKEEIEPFIEDEIDASLHIDIGKAKPSIQTQLYHLIFFNNVYILLVLGTAVYTGCVNGLSVFGPLFFLGLGICKEGASASHLFSIIIVISGVTGTPLGGYIMDHTILLYPSSNPVFLALRQMTYSMFAGAALMLASWFSVSFPMLFFIFLGLALTFLFSTTSCTTLVILRVVPSYSRALAIALNTLLIHVLGDVPSPVILGKIKDTLAPDCGYIQVNNQTILNPDCINDREGLLWTLLLPLVCLWLSVVLWGIAATRSKNKHALDLGFNRV